MKLRWQGYLLISLLAGSPLCFAAEDSSSSSFSPEQEHCVTVTGSASTENVDEAFARQMAIRNALTFAGIQNNVTISSDQSIENFQLTREATRFTSHSKVKGYQVIEEGLEEPYGEYGELKKGPLHYQVKLNVCLTEDPKVCENLSGNQYQTRLAIAPLVVAKSYQARDISNIIPGYQVELQRRLLNRGYRNLTMLDSQVGIDEQGVITPNLSKDLLEPVRDRTGAQFLLMSVLRSVSAHAEDHPYWNKVKRFYDLEVKPDTRYIEVDWYVVDLMKRTLVYQQRAGFDVKGDVRVGRDRAFGSNAFFATDTGIAFHALLNQQVQDVVSSLRCEPLETQVIDVRNNEYVLFLSADSGAKVGDELAVYARNGRAVRFQGVDLGMDETPSAFIRIKRILPRFAVAEMVAKKGVVQVGDIVKAW
ncbi:hypothetical protein [Thiomicrorhabdus sp.]|uniref:hypothetical protein n=1 Tax=Thiomicrorhabdus sp. TaxID=2039724 RepID=UPI003562D546